MLKLSNKDMLVFILLAKGFEPKEIAIIMGVVHSNIYGRINRIYCRTWIKKRDQKKLIEIYGDTFKDVDWKEYARGIGVL